METAIALNQAGWYFWDSSHSIPKPFNAMSVDSIIRRTHIYAGQIEPGQPGAHDPILPVELCQAVRQAKLVRRNVKSKGPRNKAHRVFLLSGIVYCGRCGRKLCGQGQPHFKTRERISYYRHMYNKQGCTERDVFAVDIESAALEALTRIDRDALAGDLAGDIQALFRQAALIDSQSDLEKLDSKQAEVERLIDLYQTGVITKDQLIARKAPLDSEIDELKNRVEITSLGTLADVEAIVSEVVDSLGKLHEASPELQKTILHSLIERIDIAGQRVTGITPLPWAKPFFKFWLMSSRPRPAPA
ncbi:MAG: zinc ribbon domain-containing protein [Anaerolineae bacterium]|nr:zinc ribbon domain-containing protein [Anaerolineae bacterium]